MSGSTFRPANLLWRRIESDDHRNSETGGYGDDDDTDMECRSRRHRHSARVQTPAGDRVRPAEPRQESDPRRPRGHRLHESLPLRAPLQVQHGRAAPSIRRPTAHHACPELPDGRGVVDRAGRTDGGIPDPKSLHHGIPPRPGCHAWSVPRGGVAREPAQRGRRGDMKGMAGVMERIDHVAGLDDRRPLYTRKASDPDAVLLAKLRRGDTGAAEALVAAYGDRVYRLAVRITGNASDAEEVVQDALWTVTRKIDTFRGEAALGSWVYRIAANAAYEKLRRGRSRRSEVSWEDLAPVLADQSPAASACRPFSSKTGARSSHEKGRHADA